MKRDMNFWLDYKIFIFILPLIKKNINLRPGIDLHPGGMVSEAC